MNQIYRLPEVMRLTGLSRSSIYQAIKEGRFPKQVKLTKRCVGWLQSEIQDFISSCGRA